MLWPVTVGGHCGERSQIKQMVRALLKLSESKNLESTAAVPDPLTTGTAGPVVTVTINAQPQVTVTQRWGRRTLPL